MKRILMSVVLCLCLLAAPAFAAMSKSANASGAVPPADAFVGAPILLYDQTDNATANGAPDQDFEAAFNAYDSEAADDFVVTAATGWDVERVTTVGTFTPGGGPTASVDVIFYANSAGGGDPDLPGAPVAGCSYAAIIPTSQVGGSYVIDLPTVCALPAGTFWLSVQANQNFTPNGQHFWSDRTVQSGSEAAWRNPGNGFGSGCVTFTPKTVCGVGDPISPDFLFQILGQIGVPTDADLSILKTGLAPAPGSAEFTIAVTNNGPAAATGVVVTDTFPAELAYVSDDCGGVNGSPWTWNIGNLAASASVTCTIQFDVVTAGTVVNAATVTANEPDPTSPNTSQATLVVELGGGSVLEVPTLGKVGAFALLLLLAGAAAWTLRRQRA